MSISRRKLALSASALAAVGSVAALIAGVTFSLFTSTTEETNHFVAGTVTLTSDATGACTINNPPTNDLKPGDTNATSPCTFVVNYANTNNAAYEAVDILIATKAGSGGTPLYTPGSAGLSITITDNQGTPVSYTVPVAANALSCSLIPAYSSGGWTNCYQITNELLQATGVALASDTFKVVYNLPLNTGNAYQGGSADVVLTVHAVQQKNNSIVCTPTPMAAGQSCAAVAPFSW